MRSYIPSIIKEIWQQRTLIQQLVIKDLKMRYLRPWLGFFWVILLPLFTVSIFYLVFSQFLKVNTEGVPFFLYLMSAVFPWGFFQNAVVTSTTSLVDNKNLIKESHFAHYLIPLSVVLANMLHFLPALFITVIISVIVLKGLPAYFLFLPVALLLHILIAIGISITFSILYVKFRDIKYILEVILLLLFYMTPVFYPLSFVEQTLPYWLLLVYLCNPFVGMVNLYRLTLIKGFAGQIQRFGCFLWLWVVPLIFTLGVLLLGAYVYKKNKNIINDYLSY